MSREPSRAPAFAELSLAALLIALAATGRPAAAQPDPTANDPRIVEVPELDPGIELLDTRATAQRRTLARSKVRHDFAFTDRLGESAITFRHRATEDGTKHYKMVHYDHGNGVAAADVDGDGRLDLYFVSQLGPNELWRNLGEGRFENITERAGVALADRVGVSASFADVDNDGDPDLYTTSVRGGNALFENLGGGRFRDVTDAAGLTYSGHSSAALFFDYDGDGWLDLFLANVGDYTTEQQGPGPYWIGREDAFQGHLHPERTERSILYRNLGEGRFRDVSEETGLVETGWNGDATFADLDGDHDPDLYVTSMQGDDHYWVNEVRETGRFVERTAATFPKTPWGAMGLEILDYNNDGLLDLFLTDMHSDMSQGVPPTAEKLKADMLWTEAYLQGSADNIFGNALWENRGGGKFAEVSDLVGVETYWPWGVSAGDLNADGWEDLFVAGSMSYPWRYGVNSVLLNDEGRVFRDAELVLGVEPRAGGARIDYFELDCSGADRGHEHCGGQEGRVVVRGNLGTRGSVLLDLDGDGDLDIVTAEFHAPPQVLISDLAQRHSVRSVEVVLTGTRSNRDGLGALVALTAGGATQVRSHDGKSGYLAQSSMPLHFGLGDAETIERIVVTWPSGTVQTVTEGLRIGGRVEIVEPPEH
ncbi:MAG TPA: CRTAC1 family protein [Thermoanaerobaculia bacterium]|nr:CRTAC1 family protein [Thermoanaerobaculia bacterium]